MKPQKQMLTADESNRRTRPRMQIEVAGELALLAERLVAKLERLMSSPNPKGQRYRTWFLQHLTRSVQTLVEANLNRLFETAANPVAEVDAYLLSRLLVFMVGSKYISSIDDVDLIFE